MGDEGRRQLVAELEQIARRGRTGLRYDPRQPPDDLGQLGVLLAQF